ncbi:MAG: hypothetical protein II313_07020 [Anaerotignum sp.]|nr:hypothetical protein [Anaerotignum sp.]
MNAKSTLKVKYAEGIIEMNTTFAKMMQNPLSDEYALLQKTRMDFPTFAVRTRQIKSNPKKDTYKGLTYEYMKMYIKTHETEEQAKEIIAYLDDQILISKCHSQRLRYPTIKKWFLAKYPDVAKFGIVEVAKLDENAEEVKSQNVVPFSAAKKTETVEVTDAEAEVITDDIEKVG